MTNSSDFRILEAVDIPELYHLEDVLVFPVKGRRPHPIEISGGDLDGDQYFVTYLLMPILLTFSVGTST